MSKSRTRKPGGRSPLPVRRMGSEIIADRRTRGQRQRGQADRAEIEAELDEGLDACQTYLLESGDDEDEGDEYDA